jgi:hypothetical protein
MNISERVERVAFEKAEGSARLPNPSLNRTSWTGAVLPSPPDRSLEHDRPIHRNALLVGAEGRDGPLGRPRRAQPYLVRQAW